MEKTIITISREFGSGGRTLGHMVAEKLGIPFYDKELVDQIALESGFAPKYVEEHGEHSPSGSLFSYAFAPQLIGLFIDSQEAIHFGTEHMQTIAPFFCLAAFSHCIAAIMRGAGKPTVPMFTMLACWCLFRVTYITIAVKYINELTTVSFAYPITWVLSSVIFLVYYLKADWIHNFDRMEAAGKV